MIKKICNQVPVILFILFLLSQIHGEENKTAGNYILIEDFEISQKELFTLWLRRSHSPAESSKIYSIGEEKGNSFLRASTKGNPLLSIQLGKIVNDNEVYDKVRYKWNVKKYPFLQWDWRANVLPKNADESKGKFNDCAAGIYVATQKLKIPLLSWKYQPVNVLKYTWSSSLKPGRIVHRNFKFLGIELYHVAYMVVQSGETNRGRWMTQKRNIREDYKTAFGEYPSYNPTLIGILTDSNETNSEASADYDNIFIMSE